MSVCEGHMHRCVSCMTTMGERLRAVNRYECVLESHHSAGRGRQDALQSRHSPALQTMRCCQMMLLGFRFGSDAFGLPLEYFEIKRSDNQEVGYV